MCNTSMVAMRCIQSFDKYHNGVVYVVQRTIARMMIAALPSCFEWADEETAG